MAFWIVSSRNRSLIPSQIRSSGQSSAPSLTAHCKWTRLLFGPRVICAAKPSSLTPMIDNPVIQQIIQECLIRFKIDLYVIFFADANFIDV